MTNQAKPSAGKFNTSAERSHTLPASWYTDTSIFEREKEHIFYCNWWYAGPASQVAQPGSYFTTQVVDQAVFVIRGADGVLRGFTTFAVTAPTVW